MTRSLPPAESAPPCEAVVELTPQARATDSPERRRALPARVWPALLLLGFASGLPQPLVDATFSTWLAKVGYRPAEIVLLGYVTLPYALKALWAPLVDRYVPPVLGRRRGWSLATQLALLAGLAVMALVDPLAGLGPLMLAAALVAVASATQDLVVNGYTCDALPPQRLAAGAGLSVWGYRVALLVSGGVALVLADRFGWGAAYASMALLVLAGIAGTLLAPEPARGACAAPPATLRAAVVEPLAHFRRALGTGGLLLLLLLVLLYRLPDGLANLLVAPFQAELYDLTSLGLTRGVIGLLGVGAGAALAAWLVPRLGLVRCLWLFGLAQALSNLGYVGLDQRWWGGLGGLVGTWFVDQACGAMAAIAFVAYLMGFCSSSSSATQYALLTTVSVLGPHLVRQPVGELQAALGWSAFFLVTLAAVIPGLAVLACLRSLGRRLEQADATTLSSGSGPARSA